MSIHSFLLQFTVLFAPFVHTPTEQVSPVLWRGADPKIGDIYKLHEQGIKTIVSLRLHPEKNKEKLCEKLHMNWIQIKTGVFLVPTNEQFDQFRSIINNPKNQPCYTSCEVSMDRVGVYLAAHQMVDNNWSEEDVEADFKKHHQKKWWPPFRKYKQAVIEYAAKRKSIKLSQ